MKFIGNIIKAIRSKKGTIVRTALQVLAYVNQIVALAGMSTFASAAWYQWLSAGVTIAITILNWWENNDFTAFAQTGTKVLDALEDGKITIEEVNAIFEKTEEKKTKE